MEAIEDWLLSASEVGACIRSVTRPVPVRDGLVKRTQLEIWLINAVLVLSAMLAETQVTAYCNVCKFKAWVMVIEQHIVWLSGLLKWLHDFVFIYCCVFTNSTVLAVKGFEALYLHPLFCPSSIRPELEIIFSQGWWTQLTTCPLGKLMTQVLRD